MWPSGLVLSHNHPQQMQQQLQHQGQPQSTEYGPSGVASGDACVGEDCGLPLCATCLLLSNHVLIKSKEHPSNGKSRVCPAKADKTDKEKKQQDAVAKMKVAGFMKQSRPTTDFNGRQYLEFLFK